MKRAMRRHHRMRLKAVRKGYWCSSDKTPRQLGILVTTAQVCSSYCCGNPRKWFGSKTRQELRAEEVIDESEYG